MRKIAIFGILLTLSLFGTVITREDVISSASQYVPINNWTPEVDSTDAVDPTWHSWYKTSENGGNAPYDKLAYCWSGFDTPSEMKSRTESGNNPVPAGGYGTFQYGYCRDHIAGIDCSGFVLKCWQFANYDTYQQLIDNSIEIENDDLRRGDLLRKTEHSILYFSGNFPGECCIYESQADPTVAYFPGVLQNVRVLSDDDYTPYSIFPQFSNEQPEDGIVLEDSQTVDISLTIEASGNITSGGISMLVNGMGVTETELQSQGDNTWSLTASDYDVSGGGEFNITVKARNDVDASGHGYQDDYQWKFFVTQDSTPAMVTTTNPHNNAQNIPVDLDSISITFSKAMDTVATEGAVNASFSYSTSWSDENNLKLNIEDTLDYCEEYRTQRTEYRE